MFSTVIQQRGGGGGGGLYIGGGGETRCIFCFQVDGRITGGAYNRNFTVQRGVASVTRYFAEVKELGHGDFADFWSKQVNFSSCNLFLS